MERSCKERAWDSVDVVIIGGDFQATRNTEDLTVMSVPAKYREMGDFHEYYSGARQAPYLTLFVGGNHEAAAHLWELYYGGWVAPNIYYLGAANVVRVGPLRIAAMSGIWKGFDYRKPHHERLPFSPNDVKTFYHVREIDVRKLLQVRGQVDVGLSHDWPRGIERHGDAARLFRMKPYFEQESHDGSLGNPAAEYVMDRLRPAYWFSAHLHCKFSAIKKYEPPREDREIDKGKSTEAVDNPDEIDLGMDDDDETGAASVQTKAKTATASTDELRAQLGAAFSRPEQQPQQPRSTPGQPVPASITNTTVRFLALDKCLPRRKFLQLCELHPVNPTMTTPSTTKTAGSAAAAPRFRLQYDPEWLAITRVFHDYLTIGDQAAQVPPDLGEEHYRALIAVAEAWVSDHVVAQPSGLDVPHNFTVTAPPHGTEATNPGTGEQQPNEYTNPQTEAFCALLDIKNLWAANEEERLERRQRGPPPAERFGGWASGSGGFRGGGRGWRGGRQRGAGGRGRGRGRA